MDAVVIVVIASVLAVETLRWVLRPAARRLRRIRKIGSPLHLPSTKNRS